MCVCVCVCECVCVCVCARARVCGNTYRRQMKATYPAHRGDSRGVPRADVRVERRLVDHLRAEPPAVHADGKCTVGPDACAPNHARERARARAQGRACGAGTYGDTFI
jgi:hypothetical protein